MSSSSISDADINALDSIGHDTVENFVCLVVEAVLYTIYFMLVVSCGRIYLKPARRNAMSTFIFVVILTMFMLDTAMCIIDVNNAIREVTLTLFSTSLGTVADRYDSLALPWTVENAIYSFMMNLGDVIICWRAYAFYRQPRERWILLIPLTFLVGSFAMSFLISFCVSKADPELGDFINPPFCVHIQIAAYSMTLATTAIVTAMIGWKTWIYRRTIGTTIRETNRKTRAEKVMGLLVESGLLYLVFCLVSVIDDSGPVASLEESTPRLAFANSIWTYMTSHIVGIYPALVVILVNSQKSYIDGVEVSSRRTALLSHTSHTQSGSGTAASSQRPYWGTGTMESSRPKKYRTRSSSDLDRTLKIEIHEMQEVSGDATFGDTHGALGNHGPRSPEFAMAMNDSKEVSYGSFP
ncbi:unnamed protein product [Peniophora sp. CBMAI 1063]|nr:unnamed protein product [Peniophora sp. CBMAI 1063]